MLPSVRRRKGDNDNPAPSNMFDKVEEAARAPPTMPIRTANAKPYQKKKL